MNGTPALLRGEFPGFRSWDEVTSERTRYKARNVAPAQSLDSERCGTAWQ